YSRNQKRPTAIRPACSAQDDGIMVMVSFIASPDQSSTDALPARPATARPPCPSRHDRPRRPRTLALRTGPGWSGPGDHEGVPARAAGLTDISVTATQRWRG